MVTFHFDIYIGAQIRPKTVKKATKKYEKSDQLNVHG